MAADVEVVGGRKAYGAVVAVEDVDIHVGEGEFFTLLGPSGSGKTTTLRLIAGFELPDSGAIELDGVDVTRKPPYQPFIAPASRFLLARMPRGLAPLMV